MTTEQEEQRDLAEWLQWAGPDDPNTPGVLAFLAYIARVPRVQDGHPHIYNPSGQTSGKSATPRSLNNKEQDQ